MTIVDEVATHQSDEIILESAAKLVNDKNAADIESSPKNSECVYKDAKSDNTTQNDSKDANSDVKIHNESKSDSKDDESDSKAFESEMKDSQNESKSKHTRRHLVESKSEAVTVNNNSVPSKVVTFLNDKTQHQFLVGDVVKAKLGYMMFEGVIVGYKEIDNTYEVDFGDDIENVRADDCSLVLNGLDYEIGDKVTCCPNGSILWFQGTIVNIDRGGTFAVLMDGDDDTDIEVGISPENMRKIRTGRNLVTTKWQKAFGKVVSIHRFSVRS